MHALSVRRPPAILVLLSAALCLPARADWNEGDSHKMHYPQLPDLTTNGMDVNATFAPPTTLYTLADDFLCTEDGPITNIHIWGSWWQDGQDTTAVFKLSIHADIPTNEIGSYSMPSNPPLWEMYFTPANTDYTWRIWAFDLVEGWYEPPDGPGSYSPNGDTICIQYNFPIDVPEAFVQKSGTVYWLDVSVQSPEGQWFGWKTSATHWNDDAVFALDMGYLWQEMRYPNEHPFAGESVDLAFVIQGGAEEVPSVTNVLCPKWLQPPDCDIGLDVQSFCTDDNLEGPLPFVADDWQCDGRTVNGIRWWGSYIGWSTNDPNPELPPPPNRPVGFYIKWYNDVPEFEGEFSHPGDVLARDYYVLDTSGNPSQPGIVYEQTACVSQLTFIGPEVYEHEYVYSLEFPASNVWNEKDGNIYWLSIQAVYPTGEYPETNRWGWKTTPVWYNWNDDAVFVGAEITNELVYPPMGGWGWVTNHPYAGNSVNMAFELLTDICPARCKKWQQPPDMVEGVNAPSWKTDEIGHFGVLRADDFVSDGRPITDIHWWGSYIGWEQFYPGNPPEPVPLPTGINAPLGFNLSWHMEGPLSGCVPGLLITNIFVSITNCHETYYGTVVQFWRVPPTFEHEYQYYVDLLDQDLELEPWLETNEVRYWVNIQAVFSTNFLEQGSMPHQGWGWKITPSPQLCVSAVDIGSGLGWTNEILGAMDPLHPRSNEYFDLSFELTTTEIGTNLNNLVEVVFTNMYRFPSTWFLTTTGYCGCGKQVLQETIRLSGDVSGPENWLDIQTNLVPHQQNIWAVSAPPTQRFFRVIQRQ